MQAGETNTVIPSYCTLRCRDVLRGRRSQPPMFLKAATAASLEVSRANRLGSVIDWLSRGAKYGKSGSQVGTSEMAEAMG